MQGGYNIHVNSVQHNYKQLNAFVKIKRLSKLRAKLSIADNVLESLVNIANLLFLKIICFIIRVTWFSKIAKSG